MRSSSCVWSQNDAENLFWNAFAKLTASLLQRGIQMRDLVKRADEKNEKNTTAQLSRELPDDFAVDTHTHTRACGHAIRPLYFPRAVASVSTLQGTRMRHSPLCNLAISAAFIRLTCSATTSAATTTGTIPRSTPHMPTATNIAKATIGEYLHDERKGRNWVVALVSVRAWHMGVSEKVAYTSSNRIPRREHISSLGRNRVQNTS